MITNKTSNELFSLKENFYFFFLLNILFSFYFYFNLELLNIDLLSEKNEFDFFVVSVTIAVVSNILAFYLTDYRKNNNFNSYSMKDHFLITSKSHEVLNEKMPKKIYLFYEPASKALGIYIVVFVLFLAFTGEIYNNYDFLLILLSYYVITAQIRFKMICHKYEEQLKEGFFEESSFNEITLTRTNKRIYLSTLNNG